MQLKNKVAIITAAASGMGRCGAQLFAKEGAKVNILDLDEKKGEEITQEIKSSGGEAHFYKVDLSNVAQIQNTVEKIGQQYGKIDILWNHVGTPGPSGLEDVNEKEYDFAMDLNLKSGFFTTKYVAPLMRKAGGGTILFTSSVSGLKASPYSAVYSAAKSGVVNLVRSLSGLLAKDQIRVNAICPGLAETPMLEQFMTRSKDDDLEKNKRYILDRIPWGRFANPEDIANAALFLASDSSEYISGVNLPVDGGYLAM